MNRHVRDALPFLHNVTPRTLRNVHIGASARENKTFTSIIVTNDVSTATKNPSESDIRVLQQTLIRLRFASFVLVLSTAAGIRLFESKPLTRETEPVIIASSTANILPLITFSVLVTSLATKTAHPRKKTVTPSAVEFKTLKKQLGRPFHLKNDGREANVSYEPIPR